MVTDHETRLIFYNIDRLDPRAVGSVFVAAQSTSQDFPTAVTSNEIAGTIRARDIGDSRLTTYFYTFNGNQGDVFINIVTRNFTGDVDVFAVPGLRPVTKIVIYANDSDNETGRAVYFRKSEKLILRIQGRTPNDDPASFRIKFAGSFVAARESDQLSEPELPKVASANDSRPRVNSVGTLLPPIPKPTPVKSEETDAAEITPTQKKVDQSAEPAASADPPKADVDKSTPGLEVVVTDTVPKTKESTAKRTPARRSPEPRSRITSAIPNGPKPPPANLPAVAKETPVKKAPPKRTAKKSIVVKEPVPDPLASIRLVIALKDGNIVEKTMNEVFKFSVDKGVLTVILKGGAISRYPMVDVAKVTIE